MADCDISSMPQLHAALANRFSPTAFDPNVTLTNAQIDILLEAARRAPSAGNSQPWRFIVGVRGGVIHSRIVRHLAGSAAGWAPDASLLIVNLAQVSIEGAPDWPYSDFSHYDLGQAVAHMTIQGLAIGLDSHQFRAFDQAGIAAEFDVPTHLQVTSITAFGIAMHGPGEVPGPGTSRERLSLAEITWARD